MAEAARQNLRLQKELKLLLSDPPPGASFPHLSPNSSDLSSFSLTSIDAQIEGPEGTVYEKGVFKIKIQIPERYPFQPPIVTFGTPIYHPNIDTGGRICLDILNLPPKGAWQPSLNISTVLTSIGLLLSEPNPDDGLMCEASKEYKYNKQVFDQKARSMTEKFARSNTSPNHGGIQLVSDTILREDKPPEPVKTDVREYAASFKKLSGTGRKLSLDASCSGSNPRNADIGMNKITSNTSCQSQIQEQKQDSKDMSLEYGKDHVMTVMNSDRDHYNKPPVTSSKKLCLSSKNLQHEILDASCSGSNTRESDMGTSKITSDTSCRSQIREQKQDSKDMSLEYGKDHVMTAMNSDRDHYNKPPIISSKKLCLSSKNLQHEVSDSTLLHDLDAQKENLLKDQKKSTDGICLANPKRKKLGLTGKKPSLGFRKIDDKVKERESKAIPAPVLKLPRKPLQALEGKHNHNMNVRADAEIPDTNVSKIDEETLEHELCDPEGVIVLDSEDSEEEKPAASNSRRLIARKRVLGKY